MKKFLLSSIIAATFTFAGFNTTANATVTSSTTTIKKVKAEGDIHRTQTKSGHTIVQQENADGSMYLVCIC
ncbi:hypothetical protein Fleli_0430 [Bernardetia litoralis DSM 6794]|uniref:Uncharacterized protein n=1 Tax=Bernardetia litoralis (strain ATCC 23117 / DSM 6794 / NBRC 15988 / NCIMB 1366 / Fx l1 / Sio-4) TaxID=880071 RepID=I4AG21_BERLS|nr:hypothetical protein [Bernardetia litoralis]AFM02906.1 hypothetical protein Fleli_0430 [Bernardetia litoralis DSM 6794]